MFQRFAFLLIAAFGLFAGGPAHAGLPLQHWQTAAGTPVYFVPSPALPILDIEIDFAAGSLFDPPEKAGLAALTHALLDLGAGDLDENAISERLADVGAKLDGSLDRDRASLVLRTLSTPEKRAAALAVLEQVLAAPRFEAAVFAREQARRIAALKDALTRPEVLGERAFWQALYPDHPYGRLSTPESLAGIAAADLRAFWQRHYTAGNATLTLVGDLSRAEAEALAERLSARLPAGGAVPLPPPPVPGPGGEIAIAHPAAQAHLFIGLPAIARGDPDFFPLLVGNYSLGGGGFVSRLMHEVREKRGYAYSVYSYFMPMRAPGPFQIGLQTRRNQAAAARQVVDDVLKRFLAEGPSAAEIRAAKANLVGSFPLRLDSNRKILDNVALIGFYGLPLDYLDRYPARVEAVSAADIRAAFLRHVVPERLTHVTVAGE